MKVLDAISGIVFVVALISLPVLIYDWIRYMDRRAIAPVRGIDKNAVPLPWRSIIPFAASILIVFCVADISENVSRSAILEKLESLKSPTRILIDGKAAPNEEQIIAELKKLAPLPAHHSHPTRQISVEISTGPDRLILSLSRDSGNPREYWVFDPKHLITRNNEVGRIVTTAFDSY